MSRSIFLLYACSISSIAMDLSKQKAPSEDPFIRSFRSVLRAIAKGAAAGVARNASRGAAGTIPIPRAETADCTKWLADGTIDMCMVAGGLNPEVKGDKDHYNGRAWSQMFLALPHNDCSFCGAAGKYFGLSEGVVMLTCQHTAADGASIHDRTIKKNSRQSADELQTVCVSYGKKLNQDTVLMRFGSKAWWAKTTNPGVNYDGEGVTYEEPACYEAKGLNGGVPFKARFHPNPKPVDPKKTPFFSDVAAASKVLFDFDTSTPCTKK